MSNDTLPYNTPVGENWTPPATVGGSWCRINKAGIYEFWPVAGPLFTPVFNLPIPPRPGTWVFVTAGDLT